MKKQYKYLLFDADNTLFDFNTAEHRAFLALSDIDSDVFSEESYELYHKINDRLWKRLEKREITKDELKRLRFAELYCTLGRTANDETLNAIVKTYPRKLALGSDLLSGVLETVKELSERYSIYIITNGIYEVQTARLENSVIRPYVKHSFISEKVGYEKPAKEFFDHVLEYIGDHNPDNYIVIGDSLSSDIDGAIASGIDCVYYDPEDHGTDGRSVTFKIADIRELLSII